MSFSSAALTALASPYLWQLGTSVVGGSDFIGAWNQNSAAGVTISIVDEGVNYLHADLLGSYNTAIDYDPRDVGASDAMPDTSAQHHGTEVAGLIAGNIDNGLGTVGAAQGATITGTYMRFGALSDLSELDEIIGRQKNYDVSNNSWGFTTSFSDNFKTGQFAAAAAALQTVAEDGRDGLGTVMVVAAGNGRIQTANGNIGDDSNFHNLSNSRFVIAVGAHDQSGAPAFFSSPGTNVLLTAPGVGILTDDGTSAGSTATSYFSGTSAATPLVSSTVALMLAANPDLGYRDVQEILAISATSRLDGHSAANGFDGYNGGGLMFDRLGGYGMLDASAAVALARNWSYTSTTANERELDFSFTPTTNLDPTHASLTYNFTPANAEKFSTGYVEIDLAISDADLADLRIDLVSPNGTDSELAENLIQAGGRTYLSFTFSSVQMMGENPYGTWTLSFSHATPAGTFTVYQADVHVYGDVRTADDTYYYTSSYTALAAADATRMHAVDTDGGSDTLNFAAGDQKVVLDLSGATASSFQNTPVYLDGSFENAIGTMYDDVLTGSAGNNKLVGDLGNDVLSGGAGNDILLGGTGNDVLNGGSGSDTIDGGAGLDTAIFEGAWSDYDISFNAANGSYRVVHHGTSDVDIVTGVELFDFLALGTGSRVDVTRTIEVAPTMVSVAAATAQTGLQGAARSIAVITATDTNLVVGDQLSFHLTNADGSAYHGSFLIGQTSATTAVIYSTDSAVHLDGSVIVTISDLTGHTVSTSVNLASFATSSGTGGLGADPSTVATALSSYTLATDSLNLTHTGNSDFVGTGNALDNVLTGGGGNNHLIGGAGNDMLIGGGSNVLEGGVGNDTYFVHSSADVVIENANEGVDTVRASSSLYALSANIENLAHAGDCNFIGVGNALDNVITGAGGNDYLIGLDGNDILIDGGGADMLQGGTGDDRYIVQSSDDVVYEYANEGTDEVDTFLASYHLSANVENLTFVGATSHTGIGNELDNVITGAGGNDTLDGGAGVDHLIGGAGNDTYLVDNSNDIVVENANEGTDTVLASSSLYTLSANVENLTHTGGSNFIGVGNALDNVITGGTGNDYLIGLDGNDILIDGGGADMLQGGTGNDRYIVQSNNDSVYEYANEGTDEVDTFLASYHLSANVENLTFVGTTSHTGIGNELDNVITGGGGNDYLIGLDGNDLLIDGGGADMLQGGTGNDRYIVQSNNDSVYEYANEGTDEVDTFLASYHLAANVENLTFVGTTSHSGTGNELNNVIAGAGGSDTLNGLTGNDTLTGGAGADQFVFSTAIAGGSNVDTITDFTVNVDHIVLDHSIFSAIGTGALADAAFTAGAETANTRIVYDANSGVVSYDADGAGGAAAIQFATVAAHLNLTAHDFLIP